MSNVNVAAVVSDELQKAAQPQPQLVPPEQAHQALYQHVLLPACAERMAELGQPVASVEDLHAAIKVGTAVLQREEQQKQAHAGATSGRLKAAAASLGIDTGEPALPAAEQQLLHETALTLVGNPEFYKLAASLVLAPQA